MSVDPKTATAAGMLEALRQFQPAILASASLARVAGIPCAS